uniref:Uncharacterized protein n=1 Tax=Glossina austeni TaxID=7395 RepID=A0A1A9UZL4_GLOAU
MRPSKLNFRIHLQLLEINIIYQDAHQKFGSPSLPAIASMKDIKVPLESWDNLLLICFIVPLTSYIFYTLHAGVKYVRLSMQVYTKYTNEWEKPWLSSNSQSTELTENSEHFLYQITKIRQIFQIRSFPKKERIENARSSEASHYNKATSQT